MEEKLEFPKGFLWGSAISAYQTEGNNKNSDWWEWEQAGHGKEPSGEACDFYHRYEKDFSLLKSLNQNSFRFSIEWSRIEPEQGKFSKEETEHYRKVLKNLKEKGIKVFATLHHFTNPLWFSKLGGFESKNSPQLFERYAGYCAENFGDLVDFWQTINEPNVYVAHSFYFGNWPPQKKNPIKAIMVYLNLAKAHNLAYHSIKKINKDYKVGIAFNAIWFSHPENGVISSIFTTIHRKIFVDMFLLPFRELDFLGVNYYLTFKVRLFFTYFEKTKYVSDFFGWPAKPNSLYELLKYLGKYMKGKPLYITENGIADAKDLYREDYIKTHLIAVHRAISEGVNIRGYLYWSFMDNFEWHTGYGPRFGLVEIDREHGFKRIVRKSALYYAKVCGENAI